MTREWTTRPAMIALALAIVASALRADSPATTQPESIADPTPEQVAAMLRASGGNARWEWTKPTSDRFDGATGRSRWRVQQEAKLAAADGLLKVAPTQAKSFGSIMRPLPEPLRDAAGMHVDLWLRVPKVNEHSRLILWLHADKPTRVAWDHAYYFSYGQQGRQQQFCQWKRGGGFSSSRWARGNPLKSGQLIHVRMKVVSNRISVNRGGEFWHKRTEASPISLSKEAWIGLACYRCEAEVVRVDYRALDKRMLAAKKKTFVDSPFGNAATFRAWLHGNLFPRLADESFERRQAATDLLRRLMPLAKLQVEEEAKQTADPEQRIRLRMLLDTPLDLQAPSIEPDDIDPPKLPESQPAEGK
jgi:hypothetical protein